MRVTQRGTDDSLYRQLARRIEEAIANGSLAPGGRLPSIRECAQIHGVSLNTVLQAYKTLEDTNLIEVRPQAGHFVAQRRHALPEPEVSRPSRSAVNVDVSSLIDTVMGTATADGVRSFGSGYPSFEHVHVERVRQAVVRAAQRSGNALALYTRIPGKDAVRQAIARRALSMGCILDPADVIVTGGATAAITLCLQTLLRPGQTVALESPTSFGFLRILQALGLKALEVPTHPRHGLSVDALALALRTQRVKAVLATPTLSNPLGTSMPPLERERLAALLSSHRVPMIEDVVYNDQALDEASRRTVQSYGADGWVLLCCSYSKTLAPGLRVGWVHSERFGARLRMVKAALSGGENTVNEMALAALLEGSSYARHMRRLRELHRVSMAEARELVAASFPAGTRMTDPQSGALLWIELPLGMDSEELYKSALSEGIVFAPGTMFSASKSYRHCLRLSIPGVWDNMHRQALRRLGQLAREQTVAKSTA